MGRSMVRRAVRETLVAPEARYRPPGGEIRDRYGAQGIGAVLRFLHEQTVAEPLPSDLEHLLQRLDAAERCESA